MSLLLLLTAGWLLLATGTTVVLVVLCAFNRLADEPPCRCGAPCRGEPAVPG